MRGFVLGVLGLAAVAAVGFFFVAMPVMDRRMNRVAAILHQPVSAAAESLHATLAVADLHADPLLWPRSLIRRVRHGHVDLPRLVEGRVALQVFSAVTQTPRGLNYLRNDSTTDNIRLVAMASRWPVRTWGSRLERALHQADKLHRAATASAGQIVVIRTTADLSRVLAERARRPDLVGALLAIEGGHAADGTIENLERLHAAGYRMIGLTHFFDNLLGGSSGGMAQGGLTEFGRQAVRWMEKRRVIVDLAHASPAVIDDVLAMASRGVVVSHGGVQGTCPGPRNLTDDAARRIAAAGGLIGIGFWAAAVCGLEPDTIAAAIRYAVDLVGVEHVAIGSDFDGAVTTGFDASSHALVTDALLRRGFAPGEIRAIMGGNVLRFLMEHLPGS